MLKIAPAPLDSSPTITTRDSASWAARFQQRYGRKPRVLHIGNIANNAYRIAKALNAADIDCDVICYNYYHVMGCPEWEDVDFQFSFQDQFRPDWSSVNLGGYKRPRWFAQGELQTCIEYLLAQRKNDEVKADKLWDVLRYQNRTRRFNLVELALLLPHVLLPHHASFRHRAGIVLYEKEIAEKVRTRVESLLNAKSKLRRAAASLVAVAILLIIWSVRAISLPFVATRAAHNAAARELASRKKTLVNEFQHTFPARTDQLMENELQENALPEYLGMLKSWLRLFADYDIVQAYATDPVIPLVSGWHPYVAFEHGTLREFTVADNVRARLNSLAYNKADHVFITNADCRNYALRIGVTRFSGLPHPIDDIAVREFVVDRADVRDGSQARNVFLCTLRHDWAVKGTDKYIRALPGVRVSLGDRFQLIMTKWGADLESSRTLAQELGVASFIEWIEPLPRHALIKMMRSVDIVFDQIALPHFGATAPEAMAAGTPVIMSYDPSSTNWLIPEPAPILSAWSPEEIVSQIKVALDPAWRLDYKRRSREWIDRWHSLGVLVGEHVNVYSRLCPAS